MKSKFITYGFAGPKIYLISIHKYRSGYWRVITTPCDICGDPVFDPTDQCTFTSGAAARIYFIKKYRELNKKVNGKK